MKKNIVILALVLAAVVVVVLTNNNGNSSAGTQENSPEASYEDVQGVNGDISKAPKQGAIAPGFTLASLDGTSEFKVGGKRDKVLIINFWAAWCGPCELEAPDLVDIYDKHKDKVDLYAVNVTKFDKLREAKDFVKEQGFKMPVLTDDKGEAGDLYKVFSYPTSFIVDRNGVILQRIEGVIDREQWETYLEQAIAS
ncbi:TlpA family protein disulfide reductase [Cohnella yongneupensis]|uniref:TlpA family protein disulfide reductase n=1 Tax=Cohnella yongneupensis TaxID=425006 RepID=A0ABW0QWK8_9BACL